MKDYSSSDIIRATNSMSQQIMDLMKAMTAGYLCGYCGSGNTCMWVATACMKEHVETTRVCQACAGIRGGLLLEQCINCQGKTIDWAVKADGYGWVPSWV